MWQPAATKLHNQTDSEQIFFLICSLKSLITVITLYKSLFAIQLFWECTLWLQTKISEKQDQGVVGHLWLKSPSPWSCLTSILWTICCFIVLQQAIYLLTHAYWGFQLSICDFNYFSKTSTDVFLFFFVVVLFIFTICDRWIYAILKHYFIILAMSAVCL